MSSTAVADRRIEQLVAAFENATIDARDFNHEAHLLVGWRAFVLPDLGLKI